MCNSLHNNLSAFIFNLILIINIKRKTRLIVRALYIYDTIFTIKKRFSIYLIAVYK